MAVDWIARLLAMVRGSIDAYTKAETDTLLAAKADLANGKVPAAQLPSYVDDVLEYNSTSAFPATGESGKIYVATDTNKTYRWGGSAYVEISESLALGETASTAYPGNNGKANADAIAAMKDGQGIDSFGDVETALAGKADASHTHTRSQITDLGTAASKGFDAAPTSGNTNNAVSSDGVYQAIAVVDVSSMITARSGFTITGHTRLHRQCNRVFGTIAVKKDSGYFGDDIACDFSSEITPAYQVLVSAGFGTGEWNISAIGTAFLSNTSSYLQVVNESAGSYDYVHVQVDYFTS